MGCGWSTRYGAWRAAVRVRRRCDAWHGTQGGFGQMEVGCQRCGAYLLCCALGWFAGRPGAAAAAGRPARWRAAMLAELTGQRMPSAQAPDSQRRCWDVRGGRRCAASWHVGMLCADGGVSGAWGMLYADGTLHADDGRMMACLVQAPVACPHGRRRLELRLS
jgi:hypothetical protein